MIRKKYVAWYGMFGLFFILLGFSNAYVGMRNEEFCARFDGLCTLGPKGMGYYIISISAMLMVSGCMVMIRYGRAIFAPDKATEGDLYYFKMAFFQVSLSGIILPLQLALLALN